MWLKSSLLVLCFLLFSTSGQAHPFHTSLTEIEYNADTKQLEISVKLTVVDLEEALSASSGNPVVIDNSGGTDALILGYLQSNLRIYSARPTPQGVVRPLPLQWVGKELEINNIWVFLTVPVVADQLRLENRLLVEINPRQINTVSILESGKKISHQLTSEHQTIPLMLQ